jgi:hypothetical protein
MRLLVPLALALTLVGCPFDTNPERRCDPNNEDLPDREGYDANCDEVDGDVSRSVFVSPDGSDDNHGRSPDAPMRTLEAAAELARVACDPSCDVLLAAGRYDDGRTYEPVTGVGHFGGYSADFLERDPTTHVTTLSASDRPITVLMSGLGRATWAGLTIEGTDFDATAPGTSSYAVWVRGGSGISLDTVRVVAGDGAEGTPGPLGLVPETCSSEGGSGGTAFDCGSENGEPGRTGRDAVTEGLGGSAAGSNNCPSACPLVGGDGISDGSDAAAPGGDGVAGDEGATSDDSVGTFASDGWTGAPGTDGVRGTDGAGGGGGGSGGTKRFRACFGCDTLIGGAGGPGGDGGCGGDGGGGGQGGGGSFGLVVENATVELLDVTIVTGAGGVGGAGGGGGNGGVGKPGITGHHRPEQQCGLINYSAGAGGHGGAGGTGGAGGGGAGGNGGVVIGIALLGDAAAGDDFSVVLDGVPGSGGTGGTGGTGADDAPAGITGIVIDIQRYDLVR